LLKDVEGFEVSLNPYQGVWSIENIKHWIGNKKKKRTHTHGRVVVGTMQ